jgi:hypothetical protein
MAQSLTHDVLILGAGLVGLTFVMARECFEARSAAWAALLAACTALAFWIVLVAVWSLFRSLKNPLVNGLDCHVQLFCDVQFELASSRLFAARHHGHVVYAHQGTDV